MMNKEAILEEIKKAQKDVELCRKGLNQSKDGVSDTTLQRHFMVDLAYRNGLVHALILSGECDDNDMEYLRSLPNKPMVWIDKIN